ncbi:hypothetical protein, partial [Actinokineospora inagensis]|uniref:hypothetical protein n=1 Tax=Actinokineospora inagensis TaxID=103730 RepID=UPI001B7F90C8
ASLRSGFGLVAFGDAGLGRQIKAVVPVVVKLFCLGPLAAAWVRQKGGATGKRGLTRQPA